MLEKDKHQINQNLPLLVGITGGIGSGKSLICKIFHALGVPVYDADSKARFLMENDVNLVAKIKEEFGDQTYANNKLQREYLAKIVFPNPEKLKILNSLTHPAVADDFEDWVKSHCEHQYIIKEAALFIESGSYKFLDKIILVSAAEEIRIGRVLIRDKHRNREDIESLIRRQLPDSEKRLYCDFEIVNDGLMPILQQVLDLDKMFKSFRGLS